MWMSVADVGTGTRSAKEATRHSDWDPKMLTHFCSIWLVELARQLKAASYCGIDVEMSMAPPKEWLPTNMTLEQVDMFGTVPEYLVGKFE